MNKGVAPQGLAMKAFQINLIVLRGGLPDSLCDAFI